MSDGPLTATLRAALRAPLHAEDMEHASDTAAYVPAALVRDALAEMDAAYVYQAVSWRAAVKRQGERCTALRSIIADYRTALARSGDRPCIYCGHVAARLSDKDCPRRWTLAGQWRALLVRLLARCA